MKPLHVLVIENEQGSADDAVAELTASGHVVHRCFSSGAPSFPCLAVTNPRRCPLYGEIDVALSVRDGRTPVTPYELGVSCAVRAGVPVVTQAPAGADRFGHLADAHATPGRVAAVCERAAQDNSIDIFAN
jgi:hypothetical protein